MATVKVYVDGQQLLDEIASDMLSMTGWSDSEDTTYCDISTSEFKKANIRLDSDKYIAYFGDETITLAISRNRNVTLAINGKALKMYKNPEFAKTKDFDYLVKRFYLSSRLTEYENDLIDLKITRYDENWIYLSWKYYEDTTFEAYISLDL